MAKYVQYPIALFNVTNRCNLKCKHCFVFRDGNPNEITTQNEKSAEEMIKDIKDLRDLYGFERVLWMGGEPLLRRDVLESGVKLFPNSTIATNGTLPLPNFGKSVIWSISVDGPEEINDEIRGSGSFKRIIENLNSLPENFEGDLQAICVISKKNEDAIEELICSLQTNTPIRGLILSFYVPKNQDTSDFTWKNLEERDKAVQMALKLKEKYPEYILNNENGLKLMLSKSAPPITANCPLKKIIIPFYLGKTSFEIPFCCYGNDVNCDLCGSWAVFHTASFLNTI